VAPANPFRCPPGPYERASLIAHYLKTRKPRSKLLILDAKDAFSKQGLFQEAWADLCPGMIEWVGLSAGGKAVRVDAGEKAVLLGVGHDQVDTGDARSLRRPLGGVAAGQHGARRPDASFPPRPARRLARRPGRHVGDGAGVDDVEVRLGERSHDLVARGGELPRQALDLRLVQFAAEVGKVDAHDGCRPPDLNAGR